MEVVILSQFLFKEKEKERKKNHGIPRKLYEKKNEMDPETPH